MQAVIPCGGRATRLGPIAAETPKLLVEVAGLPFAHRKLARLARAGFREVVLCVGHLGGAIRAAVGDGSRFGLRVIYVEDGDAPRGTWGAVRAAAPHLAPEVLVTYGDSLLPFDDASPLRALTGAAWADAAMTVWENEGAVEPSNAALVGERVDWFAATAADRAASPAPLTAIDFGAIAVRREALLRLPAGASGALGTLFAQLASTGRLAAHRVATRFYEIGTPQGLHEAEAAVRAGLFGTEAGA